MLIRFSIENYRSIKKKKVLSMVPMSDSFEIATTYVRGIPGAHGLFRTAMVLGPNGAGKSNLLDGLTMMHCFVSRQFKSPFAKLQGYQLDEAPTTFEVTILLDGVTYIYGFSVSQEGIQREWLYAGPRMKSNCWLDRQAGSWTLMDGLDLDGIRSHTESNDLFLTQAYIANHQQLSPIYRWFSEGLICSEIIDFRHYWEHRLISKAWRDQFLKLLRNLGFQVHGLTILPEGSPLGQPGDQLVAILKKGSGTIACPVKQLGNGFSHLLRVLSAMLTAVGGCVLVIDGFADLNPVLVEKLIELFYDTTHAQLIFSAHHLTPMDLKKYRRDQIWPISNHPQEGTRFKRLAGCHKTRQEAIIERSSSGRFVGFPT